MSATWIALGGWRDQEIPGTRQPWAGDDVDYEWPDWEGPPTDIWSILLIGPDDNVTAIRLDVVPRTLVVGTSLSVPADPRDRGSGEPSEATPPPP